MVFNAVPRTWTCGQKAARRAGRGKVQWGRQGDGADGHGGAAFLQRRQGLRSRFELPIPDAMMVYRIAPSGHTTSHGAAGGLSVYVETLGTCFSPVLFAAIEPILIAT